MDHINENFSSVIKDCEQYKEALEIVRNNSSGKIWLIGGFVYRTLANQLYGAERPEIDLDFIVEKPVEDFNLPTGWVVERNRFGNPKLVNGTKQIDYVPLENIYSILYRNLEPSIENFLSGVPLNIQAIVYDTDEEKLVGEEGINALLTKTVTVRNLHFAKYAAGKKGLSVQEMVKEKADGLGFKAMSLE